MYTVWDHPCCSVSVYCSLNLRPMHVLLCFTNKLEGNSAQVSCTLNHSCQIPALCFPLHRGCWGCGGSVSAVEGGQVQPSSAHIGVVRQAPAAAQKGCDCTGSTQTGQVLLPSSQISMGLGLLQDLSSHARIIFCLATHELNFSVSAVV